MTLRQVLVPEWKSWCSTTAQDNLHWHDLNQYEICVQYHAYGYGALRGNQFELIPAWKSNRHHNNLP